MIRRLLTAAVLSGALIAPQVAEAQHYPGQQPLATYCLSHAQEYCASFLAWETTPHEGTPYSWVRGEVQLYGGLLTPKSSGWFSLQFFDGPGPGCCARTSLPFDGAGDYLFNDNPVRPPTGTVADFAGMAFQLTDEAGSVEVLGCRVETDCVQVPEPGTYLLMLSGVLGLGFVAWRRKEDLAA